MRYGAVKGSDPFSVDMLMLPFRNISWRQSHQAKSDVSVKTRVRSGKEAKGSDPFSVKLDTRLLSQEKPSCLHHVIFIGPKPGMD